LFVVYGLLLKVAEPISGPDRSGAVSICVNLRENGPDASGGEKELGKRKLEVVRCLWFVVKSCWTYQRKSAVSICVNLRENGPDASGGEKGTWEKETWKEENGS